MFLFINSNLLLRIMNQHNCKSSHVRRMSDYAYPISLSQISSTISLNQQWKSKLYNSAFHDTKHCNFNRHKFPLVIQQKWIVIKISGQEHLADVGNWLIFGIVVQDWIHDWNSIFCSFHGPSSIFLFRPERWRCLGHASRNEVRSMGHQKSEAIAREQTSGLSCRQVFDSTARVVDRRCYTLVRSLVRLACSSSARPKLTAPLPSLSLVREKTIYSRGRLYFSAGVVPLSVAGDIMLAVIG